jgi:uncharacterized protein
VTQVALHPVDRTERIALLDVLRGFALLGILLVNFTGDIGTVAPRVDEVVSEALDALVLGSFYPLFSFLFGLGFAVQLANANARGRQVYHLYVRRMAVLFLIGTAHAVFIWSGDILVRYATLGLVLIPIHRFPRNAILLLVAVLFVAQLNRSTVRSWVTGSATVADASPGQSLLEPARSEGEALFENQLRLAEADVSTSRWAWYSLAVRERWLGYRDGLRSYLDWLTFPLADHLLYFLIGLWAGKASLFRDIHTKRRGLVVAGALGATVGLLGYASQRAFELQPGFLLNVADRAGNLGPTVLYVAGIALLYTGRGRAHAFLDLLAAPGRAALTNYLLQSVVMTLIYERYGLGLSLSTTAFLSIHFVFFFAVQVPASRWWLSRCQFGPVEWLWRSVNYGRSQPLRLPKTRPLQAPVPGVPV